MSFDDFNAYKLITTSYDGTIRCFDLENQQVELLYGDEDNPNLVTTYHKQLDASTFLFSMGSTGKVGVVDRRVSNLKTTKEFKLFAKSSPKTVDIHPVKREMFLCPNNKAECFTYDMRSDKTKEGVKQPLLSFEGHTKALSSAFFSGETGKSIATVAYDDKIRLFCSTAKETEVMPYKSIAHNNQTGRWLTTFKAKVKHSFIETSNQA